MSEYGNVIQQSFGAESAQARVIGNQLDPEKAQRAVEIGEATGFEPQTVSVNLEEFDQYHKASLGAQIVKKNQALKQYIDGHPMAAAVSGDDLGQLDTVTDRVKDLNEEDTNPLTKLAHIFAEGYGEGPVIGGWVMNNPNNFNEDGTLKYPYATAMASGLGAFLEVPMRAFGGAMALTEAGIESGYAGVTGDESGGRRLARDFSGMVDTYMNAFMGRTPRAREFNSGIRENIQKVAEDQRAQMYWQSGKALPIGLSKEFDAAIERVSKEYWKKIDDLAGEADKSATKERNPEFFRNFMEQHPELEGAYIRVAPEAVRKLYGEDVPAPNDGLLGFIDNLSAIMKVGEELGVGVRVPVIDWVTKLDKETRDLLKDDSRAKLQTVSVKEAEELKIWNQLDVWKEEKPKEVEGEPVIPPEPRDEAITSVRQSSGLEPMDTIMGNIKEEAKYGSEKLKIARMDEQARKDLDINLGSKEAFDITDEKGNIVGTLQGEKQGTNFFIDWVSSRAWAQSFGLKQIAKLKEALKEEYPDLETASGYRVSGARTGTSKQGELVTFKLEAPEVDQIFEEAGRQKIRPTAEWLTLDEEHDVKALVKPKKFWTDNEKRIEGIVNETLAKIIPEGSAEVGGASRVWHSGDVHGLYVPFKDRLPLILWSLASNDRVHTAGHEAMHHLRQIGAITKEEWKILEEAVDSEGWMKKYDIDARYQGLDMEAKFEEAIAEKFGDVVRGKVDWEGTTWSKIAVKIRDFVLELRTKLKEAFGMEITADDIFERASTGGMKRRSLHPERPDYTVEDIKAQRPTQLDLPGITRMEDQQVFEKAAGMGLTVKQYKQYMQAIEKVREADKKYQEDKALAYEKKKQTKEWKTEAEALEPKVREELEALPDYRVNEFFRTGILDGEQLPTRPKIGEEFVTSGEVPQMFVSKKGMHPDDIAGLLGIDSGKSLIDMLAGWEEARGDVAPGKFVEDLVKGEVERRMSAKHGPLSENIIDAARDHVINNAQLELIHQEVLAAALRAGSDMPISKKEMEAFAKEQFSQAPIGNVSLEEMLREMGKSQRAAAMALLDGDPKAAFKHEQKRMLTFYAAREAKKLETAQRVFDRNVKRFSEREVSSFPQEYTNFIHDIMMKLGSGKLNFTFEDWQKRVAVEQHADLWHFTDYKMQHDLLEIKYDDRLFDDTLFATKPPLDNLTVKQFMDAHEFIKSLIKNGRDEFKIYKDGEVKERAAAKQEIMNQLDTFIPLNFDAKGGRWLGPIPPRPASLLRRYGYAHLQWESIANRIDRGDPNGPFSTYIMKPLIEANNGVAPLERKYSQKIQEIADKVNLKEKIPNNLFVEPTDLKLKTTTQRPMPMTRENLRKVLLYWGSETGRQKLSEGYNIEPQKIQAWLDKYATKEDYVWADKLGKVWAELKDEIDVMYQNVAGVPAENIKLSKMSTPHGDFDGWYHPLVPHPHVDMVSVGAASTYANGLVQKGFFRATTANGHIMRRTGAVYALDLGLDSVGSIMKRQIYDLAMRPGLIEAGKFFRDGDIKASITNHFGREMTDMIEPYLSDVANAMNNNDKASAEAMQVWNDFRSNVIGNMIGFNPGTPMKHGPTAWVQSMQEVGSGKFLAAAWRSLFGVNEKTGMGNWKFATQTSEELQRRHQHYLETLKGANAQTLGETTAREKFQYAGSWMVAKSDLLSAVPTWLAKYDESMQEGLSHGDAVYMADRAVRRAHGSTAVVNRPKVMRSEIMSILNPVYGFFNHIMNRQYEMGWHAKDLVSDTAAGKVSPKEFATKSYALATMLVSYVIAPAIIEELVSPLPSKSDDSWEKKTAMGIAYTLGSSWIGLRDVARFSTAGFDLNFGILGPISEGMMGTIRDLSNLDKATDKENIGRTIKHTMASAGMLTGLSSVQLGRWAELAYNYSIDKEQPDGFWQWLVALRYGTTKGHSKTPEEYVDHLVGAH